jgi:hypothetical protein
MKTLDVYAAEWFDKINGKPYFSTIVMIDYGMDTEKIIKVPSTYGYGDFYLEKAIQVLRENGYITTDNRINSLWDYCNDNGIILRNSVKIN